MTEIAAPKKTGRPSKYSDELGIEIARRYASGEPIHVIAKDPRMPHRDTIHEWAKPNGPVAAAASFPDILARARLLKGEWHANKGREALHELSDEDLKELGSVANAAVGMRDKRANYDKWLAGCLNKQYSDRLRVDAEILLELGASFATTVGIRKLHDAAPMPGLPVSAEVVGQEVDNEVPDADS